MSVTPFRYGGVVSRKDFCGRHTLLKELQGFFEAGQNTVLFGERRIGKTSTVFEAARRVKRRVLFIDILGVRSLDDLFQQILRAIFTLERTGSFFEKLLHSLVALRPTFSPDPVSGAMTFSISPGRPLSLESIPEVLEAVAQVARHKSTVVFFDEFQDVLKIEGNPQVAVAQFRSRIQFHEDIPYVFAGSVRQDMETIFTSPDWPFFKSATPIHLNQLPFEDFAPFLQGRFEQGGRHVPSELMMSVFALCQNIPGDIQQLCETLWNSSDAGETLTEDQLKQALNLIYAREQKAYELALASLKNTNLKVLRALAHLGGETPTSKEFMEAVGVRHTNSITQAFSRLVTLRLVHRVGHAYQFDNPFFRAWLLKREDIESEFSTAHSALLHPYTYTPG
jgi:hypothetical protein